MSDLVPVGHLPQKILRPVVKPTEFIEAHKELATLINEALEPGLDFGAIPGAGDRMVLLKPGAERLAAAFGCSIEYSVEESQIDHDRENKFSTKWAQNQTSFGFYRYVIKCSLVRDNVTRGVGLGSCSTMESKYISRPRDVENTVLKMAQKRALVAAVLNTFSLSNRFTQDVEEVETPTPSQPQKPVAQPYSGKNPELVDRLQIALEAQKVDKMYWTEISNRMEGKFSKDLPGVIRAVKEEFPSEQAQ